MNLKIIAGTLTFFFALGLVLAIITNPLIAVIIMAGFSLLVIFIFRMDIGVYLVILSLAAGQLIRIPLGQDSAIQLTDILVVLLSSIWLIKAIITRQKIKSTFLGPFLLIFLYLALLSFINGLRFLEIDQAKVSFFYLVRLISYATLFFVANDIFDKAKKIHSFNKISLITFFTVAATGIMQLIIFPSLAKWAALYGWDPHIGRLFSTFLDPNFAGAFLTIGFIFSLSLLFYAKSIEGKIILLFSSLLNLVAVILTYSRSSYLFLFIAFFAFCLLRSKKFIWLGIAAMIILSLIFPKSMERIQGGFKIDESAKTRFKTWENTITIIKDHPLLGVGFNSYRYAQENYTFSKEAVQSHAVAGSDSSLLFVFVTTGFFGFLSYLIFYLLALIKTKKVFNFSDLIQQRGLALAIFSILIGLIFHSLFVNSLFYPALMVLLFIFLGIISVDYYKKNDTISKSN